MSKWRVKRWGEAWGIYAPDSPRIPHDAEPTLAAAMDTAYRYSVGAAMWEPDGIARLRELLDEAHWWRAYLEACEVVCR